MTKALLLTALITSAFAGVTNWLGSKPIIEDEISLKPYFYVARFERSERKSRQERGESSHREQREQLENNQNRDGENFAAPDNQNLKTDSAVTSRGTFQNNVPNHTGQDSQADE